MNIQKLKRFNKDHFCEDDILVIDGYEGIYKKLEDNCYQKFHERYGGFCSFGSKNYGKTWFNLNDITKDALITYLNSSYERIEKYITEILNKGLQAFESIEDIVLNIFEDTVFFAGHINKTFLKDFLKNNAFLEEEWLMCLELRNWRINLSDHVHQIDESDFSENVLENILYLIYKLREYVSNLKTEKIKLNFEN
jgi:hypothetical protein